MSTAETKVPFAFEVTWASLEKEAHDSLRMPQDEYLKRILSDGK
jgi:hypothetical protein